MAGDILEELKAKEEEMEALINDSKKRAAIIREAAVKNAREIKGAKIREIDAELKKRAEIFEEDMRREIEKIEAEGIDRAEDLKSRGEAGREKAIEEVMKVLSGE